MEKETAKQIINTLLETHYVDSLSIVVLPEETGTEEGYKTYIPGKCISVNLQLCAGETALEEDCRTIEDDYKTL